MQWRMLYAVRHTYSYTQEISIDTLIDIRTVNHLEMSDRIKIFSRIFIFACLMAIRTPQKIGDGDPSLGRPRQTHKPTHRHKNRHTQKYPQTQTQKYKQTQEQTYLQIFTQTFTQTFGETCAQKYAQKYVINISTDKRINLQIYIHIDMQSSKPPKKQSPKCILQWTIQ